MLEIECSRLAKQQEKDAAEKKLKEKEYHMAMLEKLRAEGIYR